jgi:Protein of unknown function (DUF1549)/Protein of unknown function (DUF1553)/Planctomycete cytochrome C
MNRHWKETTFSRFVFRERLVRFAKMTILIMSFAQAIAAIANEEVPVADRVDFVRDIQPLLLSKCTDCHSETVTKGGLRLDLKSAAFRGGDNGKTIVPHQSAKSLLIERIMSRDEDKMPRDGDSLSDSQVDLFKRWIDQGAPWPDGVDKAMVTDKYDWWSLRPLVRPAVPAIASEDLESPDRANAPSEKISPIDAFVAVRLLEMGLKPSPEADRRTLARRACFDLIGLPPTPEEVEAFVADNDPNAYEKLVDRLLESPHYGERWARHWLDVVHYGDTHGYDKDKPRSNAWPYRDYVIRALNSDKPYSQFIEEQIAGDILSPGTEDGITATGFIAAGPWDFIGHAEVPESKTDGMIARLLDRDDMVSNACNTFLSLTVQCARCHNHKFDPVTQEDYYRLQAVFAALDRADRSYDIDPKISSRRSELLAVQKGLKEKQRQLQVRVVELGGEKLKELDARIAVSNKPDVHPLATQFGYHSQIEPKADTVKWVQVDLGQSIPVTAVQIVGCHDNFNNIGAGFGFPVRFRIELCDDDSFQQAVNVVVDQSASDFANPGVKPQRFPVSGLSGRFVRVTATKLAARQNDFIFSLGELVVFDDAGKNAAQGKPVRAFDSIEAPPRWRASNLVDGYFYGMNQQNGLAELKSEREKLLATVVDEGLRAAIVENEREIVATTEGLTKLPPAKLVYAGMVYSGSGSFTGTGASGGKPRTIQVLARGDVRNQLNVVGPGKVPLSPDESGEFLLPEDHSEGERRVALAKWISSKENPLTWRSIVNRVWLYHFGRGIVDSPNDFGRMGQLPSHPELLDWLAVRFRDEGQSLKQLHRMIMTSATYRQSSSGPSENVIADSSNGTLNGQRSGFDMAVVTDATNISLWRMNRRKLEAEAVRDAVLVIAGKLNRQFGGPAFQDFIVEKPEHSPHYEYLLHDPEDVRIHRRSIYRFLVRSQPQPFMTTLDCADPSMSVDKRSETVTALQALALLNNRLILTMEKYMAERIASERRGLAQQIDYAFRLSFSRPATAEELAELTPYAETHGLVNLCRVLLNLNEFTFVD